MNNLFETIIKDSLTKAQLQRRLRILKDFIAFRLFNLGPDQAAMDYKKQIEYFLTLQQKNILELDLLRQEGNWMSSLGKEFFDQFNSQNYNSFFSDLQREVNNLATIVVYMPVDLPEARKSEIGVWFKKNVSPLTIYEVGFDPNLIGGCAFSYKGVYRDYSLRERINQNKQTILSSLREFKKG